MTALPTLDALAQLLRDGGFTLSALGTRLVIGRRAVPGLPIEDSREVVFHRPAEDFPWHGSAHWRHCRGILTAATGQAVPQYESRSLHQSGLLYTLEDAELWFAGAICRPIDGREVAALTAAPPAPRVPARV